MRRINWISCNAKGDSDDEKIEHLLRVLDEHVLNPMFEEYGDFCDEHFESNVKLWTFSGNFYNYSFTFSVSMTSDDPLKQRFMDGIRSNKAMPEYAEAKAEIAARKRAWKEAMAHLGGTT